LAKEKAVTGIHAKINHAPLNNLSRRETTMWKLYVTIICILGMGLTGLANADQVKVNIVYPINGASYPITDPAAGRLRSAYFTASFSVTCPGDHQVKWGFDNAPAVGSSMFYDQTSVQFVHKLPGGSHIFWVKSNCGENKVKFKIGL